MTSSRRSSRSGLPKLPELFQIRPKTSDYSGAANLSNLTQMWKTQKKKWESLHKIPDQVADVEAAKRISAMEAEATFAKTKLGAKALTDAAKQQAEADKYTARKKLKAAKVGALASVATAGLKMFLPI